MSPTKHFTVAELFILGAVYDFSDYSYHCYYYYYYYRYRVEQEQRHTIVEVLLNKPAKHIK